MRLRRAWPPVAAASLVGAHGHRADGKDRPAAPHPKMEATDSRGQQKVDTVVCRASSPPASENGYEATARQNPNGLDRKVEGIMGIISASLIEEWLGQGLATVDGPTAATPADFRAELCHLELEEQRRFLGEGEGAVHR